MKFLLRRQTPVSGAKSFVPDVGQVFNLTKVDKLHEFCGNPGLAPALRKTPGRRPVVALRYGPIGACLCVDVHASVPGDRMMRPNPQGAHVPFKPAAARNLRSSKARNPGSFRRN
jgi:predicted amidohydrolase